MTVDRQHPYAENEDTKLLLPELAGFYRWANPISWLVIRFAVGFNLFMHAWPKLPLRPTLYAERLA